MVSSRIFSLLRIFFQITLLCNVMAKPSPLVKICHGESKDICVGVHLRSRWVLASSLCKQISHKNAKVIMGNLQRNCAEGKPSKISRIYEFNHEKKIVLLKLENSEIEHIPTIKLESKFRASSCGTYCMQGTNDICGKTIETLPTIIVPCKHEGNLKDKICLKASNGTINNLDGSPMLCNDTMIGYVSLMSTNNLLTLVNVSTFYNEVNEIITTDSKMKPQREQDDAARKLIATHGKGSNNATKQIRRRAFNRLPNNGGGSSTIEKEVKSLLYHVKNMDPEKLTQELQKMAENILQEKFGKIRQKIEEVEKKLNKIGKGGSKPKDDYSYDDY